MGIDTQKINKQLGEFIIKTIQEADSDILVEKIYYKCFMRFGVGERSVNKFLNWIEKIKIIKREGNVILREKSTETPKREPKPTETPQAVETTTNKEKPAEASKKDTTKELSEVERAVLGGKPL